jgi:hypothetical protein
MIVVLQWRPWVPDSARPGSWATPFRRAAFMNRPGLVWFAVWFGGILVLTLCSVL